MVTTHDCGEVGKGRNPFTNRNVKKGGKVHNELLLLCKARHDPQALQKLRKLLEAGTRLSDSFRSIATSFARKASNDPDHDTLREINDNLPKPTVLARIEEQLDRLLKQDRAVPDAKYDAIWESFSRSIAELIETNKAWDAKIRNMKAVTEELSGKLVRRRMARFGTWSND